MADNFDLKKFLKESKVLENRYYKDAEADDAEHIDALEKDMKDDKKSSMKEKIREYILAELAEEVTTDNADADDAALNADYDPVYEGEDEDLDEAKKKDKEEDVEDVEDVEVTDTDVENVSVEDEMPAEDVPAADGGLEDIAADMKGTEADLMDNLMKAFQIAKGMNNEKLETQVGNTLKFFVSEYIGGGEQ
jgi:hypothetical protein